MSNRLYLIPVVVAVLGLGYFFWTASPDLPPEQACEAVVADLVDAFEHRDLEEIVRHLSDQFHGGEEGRSRVRGFASVLLARNEWRTVFLARQDYRARPDGSVLVDVDAALFGADPPAGDLAETLGMSLGLARIHGQFVEEGSGVWRIRKLTWERLLPR